MGMTCLLIVLGMERSNHEREPERADDCPKPPIANLSHFLHPVI